MEILLCSTIYSSGSRIIAYVNFLQDTPKSKSGTSIWKIFKDAAPFLNVFWGEM